MKNVFVPIEVVIGVKAYDRLRVSSHAQLSHSPENLIEVSHYIVTTLDGAFPELNEKGRFEIPSCTSGLPSNLQCFFQTSGRISVWEPHPSTGTLDLVTIHPCNPKKFK